MSTTVTALYDLFIPFYIPYKDVLLSPFLAIVTFMFLCGSMKSVKIKYNSKLLKIIFLIFIPILIAYLIEPIRFLYLPARNPLFIWVSFFNIICFIGFYLFSIYRFEDFYKKSIHLYWKLNYFIAISALLVFLLLSFNFINITSWGLPSSFGDNFRAKYEVLGAVDNVYSVIFNFVVIIPNYLKPIAYIGDFGSFSGLSYEPHIATYFMTPAFLLTFKIKKLTPRNFLVFFFPFIIFFLLASSLTNILGLMVLLFLYLFSGLSNKKITFISFTLVFFTIFFILNLNTVLNVIDLSSQFFDAKFSSRSGAESTSFISYITSPKTIIGYGIFNIPTIYSDGLDDIGLLGAVLILWFYLGILFLAIVLYIKGYLIQSLIGMYILFHSLKFPMHAIQLPYLYFVVFLMIYPLVINNPLKNMSRT
ncbi:hypothetical protein ABN070_17285 [Morganella morganii]|uniref:hypothetical protein n=1 Tax=Morganella morganii TaxID=582 RepID=UPI0032DBF310